jgi:hypothetical protein
MQRRQYEELRPALVCYLVLGCGGLVCPNGYNDNDIYGGLYADVLLGRYRSLRALWGLHGARLKAFYGPPLFAELVLEGLDVRRARAECQEARAPKNDDEAETTKVSCRHETPTTRG